MFTKYEADLICQKTLYIIIKGRGVRVSCPWIIVITSLRCLCVFVCNQWAYVNNRADAVDWLLIIFCN